MSPEAQFSLGYLLIAFFALIYLQIYFAVPLMGDEPTRGTSGGNMNHQAIRGLKDYNRILQPVQRGDEVLLLVRHTRTGDVGFVTVVVQ